MLTFPGFGKTDGIAKEKLDPRIVVPGIVAEFHVAMACMRLCMPGSFMAPAPQVVLLPPGMNGPLPPKNAGLK
jgi:hypothetical protein